MSTPHALVELRQWLQQPPTANLWWKCVELVESLEPGERPLLRDYLLSHVTEDKDWAKARVPCGEWDKDFSGWKLCEVRSQSISVLPDATEVYCPPQTFLLGGDVRDKDCDKDEFPNRLITLTKGLWVLSTPVTQAMFEAICGYNTSSQSGENLPANYVYWSEAIVFCNELSRKMGLEPCYRLEGWEEWLKNQQEAPPPVIHWAREADGVRLPTEVEWEAFAKAGCARSLYGEIGEIAWYVENSGAEILHPVGQKEPNAWGLYDTIGNVFEWCFDEALFDYKQISAFDPVVEGTDEQTKAIRGGCSDSYEHDLRVSYRDYLNEGEVRDYIGFRVVRNG